MELKHKQVEKGTTHYSLILEESLGKSLRSDPNIKPLQNYTHVRVHFTDNVLTSVKISIEPLCSTTKTLLLHINTKVTTNSSY